MERSLKGAAVDSLTEKSLTEAKLKKFCPAQLFFLIERHGSGLKVGKEAAAMGSSFF